MDKEEKKEVCEHEMEHDHFTGKAFLVIEVKKCKKCGKKEAKAVR